MSKSDHKISQHSSHAHRTTRNTNIHPPPAGAYLLRFVCSRHIIDAGLFHFVIISATISRQPSSLLGKAIKCASHLKAPLHKRASLSPNSSIAFWWHLDCVRFSVRVCFKRLPESGRSWWHCLENKRSTVSEPRQNKAPAKLEGKQWKMTARIFERDWQLFPINADQNHNCQLRRWVLQVKALLRNCFTSFLVAHS